MLRSSVTSTNVASIGYNPDTSTLEVEFHHGEIYQYIGVPSGVYQALLSTTSVGHFLNREVKGTYQDRKVG